MSPHWIPMPAQFAVVLATQPSVPLHTPGVAPPPPQVCGAVQEPQSAVRPPQPSL
jgi:hypothetical protein